MTHYELILVAHASLGVASAFAGTVAAFAEKGQKAHRLWGKFFTLGMLFTALSALVLTALKFNPFLLGIGLFTLYLLASGWIWVSKNLPNRKRSISKWIGVFGLISATYMLITAVVANKGQVNVVLVVFGILLLAFSLLDLWKSPANIDFARRHGGRMGGAFIAAVSAFFITNLNGMVPGLILWLGPTVIGSPLIALGIRNYYRKRSAPKQPNAEGKTQLKM